MSNDPIDSSHPRRKVLRTPAAADYLGLSPSTLEKARRHGGGPPFIRLGGRAVGYAVADLDRWLDGQRELTADCVSGRTPADRTR
jgi:Predicted transcriptional regulator